MEHTLKTKNGVSMVELIAYVALYGVVMSLLATLVFVIINSARKVNAQSLLNRGASIMYTEVLADAISLNPDYVSDVTIVDDTISIYFEKVYYYNDEGERLPISGNAEYATKNTKITYSYTKGNDKIDVKYTTGNGTVSNSTINLDYKMTVTSHDSNDISNVFSVYTQNKSNKYVTFHGDLHYDNKKMEFNFIVPVFTYRETSE